MREIQVLGIDLTDYTVKEAMKRVEEFYKGGPVSAIGLITSSGILDAGNMPGIEEWMQSLDLAVLYDEDILKAVGNTNPARIREVREDQFLQEFFRRLVKHKRTVFLLSDNEAGLSKLTDIVLGYQERVRVVGTYALDELDTDDDFLINKINITAADVVISLLSSPRREAFFKDNHMKLQASIWLMLKDGVKIGGAHVHILDKINQFFSRRLLHLEVKKQQNETSE